MQGTGTGTGTGKGGDGHDLAAARAFIAAYVAPDAAQAAERDRILAFVDEHPDALLRTCRRGHLTGSAAVLDHTGERVLLMLHRKIGRWLQMGGHADGDGDLVRVALREATEESGIAAGLVIDPVPVDVDIHEVGCPADNRAWHLDIRFLVVAPPDAVEVLNEESLALRWFPLDDLPDDFDEGGRRLVAAAAARLRASTRR